MNVRSMLYIHQPNPFVKKTHKNHLTQSEVGRGTHSLIHINNHGFFIYLFKL